MTAYYFRACILEMLFTHKLALLLVVISVVKRVVLDTEYQGEQLFRKRRPGLLVKTSSETVQSDMLFAIIILT